MLSIGDYKEIIKFLKGKNWAGQISTDDIDEIIKFERKKTLDTVNNLVKKDDEDLSVILYKIDFNNLKTAIKSVITEKTQASLFSLNGNLDSKFLTECIKNQEFEKIPEFLKDSVKESFEILLKSNDSNLSDGVIDKVMLSELMKISKSTSSEFIKDYVELFVAFCNIKTALRGCKFKKSKRFFESTLAECDSLDLEKMKKSACENLESLMEYLLTTKYKELFESMNSNEESKSIEKWFDNKVISLCKEQKINSFTIAPIIAYFLAREIEFKNVKIIYMGKKLGARELEIKERLRHMYA